MHLSFTFEEPPFRPIPARETSSHQKRIRYQPQQRLSTTRHQKKPSFERRATGRYLRNERSSGLGMEAQIFQRLAKVGHNNVDGQ